MSANCTVIVIFPIYDQFGAIRKADSRLMFCQTYTFINSNLSSYKNCKKNQKLSNTDLILLFWVKVLFLTKNTNIFQNNAGISKMKEVLVLKGKFSKAT